MAAILDRSNIGSQDDFAQLAYSGDYSLLAVQFVPSVTASCNQIDLDLKKIGTPSGNVKVKLYSDNSDAPNIQIGDVSNNVACSGISTSFTYIPFTLSTPIALTSGTKYWIVLDCDYSISTDNNIGWSIDNTTPGYGYKGYGRWNGASWTIIAGTSWVFNFKEYYDSTTYKPTGGAFLYNFI